MSNWQPDYQNVLLSARNQEVARLPLYEHCIGIGVMEAILGEKYGDLYNGGPAEKKEYFAHHCEFYRRMGYDTVTYEFCTGGAMPGSGALGGHIDPVIKNREDFEKYPWEQIPDWYFEKSSADFEALRETMPAGMKAIGGVGNGIFECVQELTGYMGLCYISADDPELYADLFRKVGDVVNAIWARFLREYGDIFCVLRFGDDLGFKSTTLISADDIRQHIIPQYKRIIDQVHAYGKPFLLHSCGNIFNVMDDLIAAGIDAKHSNEDQIALFPEWVRRYGDRIGNFGGIDTDAVCRLSKAEMKEYILDVISQCRGHGGFVFSSGNSIPDYVPVEGYLNMVEIVREWRGDPADVLRPAGL
ncbi:MAG TPA: hypothetical protein IAA58_05680 [Candidatus Gallacutalibacter stercoravium]|nr:hypothetical protein [Candidatus Gallacutalibacter stercoravium]